MCVFLKGSIFKVCDCVTESELVRVHLCVIKTSDYFTLGLSWRSSWSVEDLNTLALGWRKGKLPGDAAKLAP